MPKLVNIASVTSNSVVEEAHRQSTVNQDIIVVNESQFSTGNVGNTCSVCDVASSPELLCDVATSRILSSL